MATPLFSVDLSEDARDYRHTALEPWLPMVDRQGVNFPILRKWLGDYVAEPEWRGENLVAFFLSEEERGRLEETDCRPVTKNELEKNFAEDLDAIRSKIKKIKPESSTEQMIQRILKKTIAEQTNDLENSDFDSYFFVARAHNEPWKLVWCCGYQRADLEPLKAKFWDTEQGVLLGVRPPLKGGKVRRRKKRGVVGTLTSPGVALALVLLLGLFFFFTQPKLVVTPAEWSGPSGARIDFKVEDHRWFFFKKDVTQQAFIQSNDSQVLEFTQNSGTASAKNVGRTRASFHVGKLSAGAIVTVTKPTPPQSLRIELADGSSSENLSLALGSTKKLKAIGVYEGGTEVDLTSETRWEETGDQRHVFFDPDDRSRVQGDSIGAATIRAYYPLPREDQTFAEATIDLDVVRANFTTLAVRMNPETTPVGGSSRLEVVGIDDQGKEHDLLGSSLLGFKIDPKNLGKIDGEYFVAEVEGEGQLKVSYDDMEKSLAFTVAGNILPDDLFAVTPQEIDNAVVYEEIPLRVATSGTGPIKATSSDKAIVEVLPPLPTQSDDDIRLAARRPGQATITITQGDKSQKVDITVTNGVIDSLVFDPPVITMKKGEAEYANLVGVTVVDKDSETTRDLRVVADQLTFKRRPLLEYVLVDDPTLKLQALERTETPQNLEVELGATRLTAAATIEVGEGTVTLAGIDEDAFGVFGPVPARGKYINAGGIIGDNTLLYDAELGGLVVDADKAGVFGPLKGIPDGAVITEVDGYSLAGMGADELAAYFADHPLGADSIIRYDGVDDIAGGVLALGARTLLQPVKVLDIEDIGNGAGARLRLYLKQAGEYRVTDAAGAELSGWSAQPGSATPTITLPSLPAAVNGEYQVIIERKIGGAVNKYPQSFELDSVAPAPASRVVPGAAPAPSGPATQDDAARAIGIDMN